MKSMGATQEEYYRGVRMIRYDLVKELAIALGAAGLLGLVLAAAFSSPDVPQVTIATWAQSDPLDFVTTAADELAGSTTSAGYGNPYNTAGEGQSWGPIGPQKWFGTRIPIDSANAFVIQPLQRASFSNANLASALKTWQDSDADQQGKWLDAYSKALPDATVTDGNVAVVAGDYGPLPVMMANLLGIAQAGALDGLLVSGGHFYQTDLHAAPSLHGRWRLPLRACRPGTPDRQPVGDDERDRQLPRPDLVVAVHNVVSGLSVHQR